MLLKVFGDEGVTYDNARMRGFNVSCKNCKWCCIENLMGNRVYYCATSGDIIKNFDKRIDCNCYVGIRD